MPTLRELDARLLRWKPETSSDKDADGKYIWRDENGEPCFWSPTPTRNVFETVDSLADAHGISFLCPKSFGKNGGPVGTHSVYVWFKGSPVPADIGTNKSGDAVRWAVVGTGLDDLQLSPSILEQDEEAPPEHRCGWHGFVGTSGVGPGCAE